MQKSEECLGKKTSSTESPAVHAAKDEAKAIRTCRVWKRKNDGNDGK